MAGKKALNLERQIAVRLPADLLRRVRAMGPRLNGHPTMGPAGPWTTARVVRYALEQGLKGLERKYRRKK